MDEGAPKLNEETAGGVAGVPPVDPNVKGVDAGAAGLLSPLPNIGAVVLPPPNEKAGVLLNPVGGGCVAATLLLPPNVNPPDAGTSADVGVGVLLLFPNIPPEAAFCAGVPPNRLEPICGWLNMPPVPFVLLGVGGASDPNGFTLGCSGAPLLLPKLSPPPVAFPPKEGVGDAAFGVPNRLYPLIPPSEDCGALPLDPNAGLGVAAKKLGMLDPPPPPPRAPVAAPPRPRPFFKGAILYPSAKRSESTTSNKNPWSGRKGGGTKGKAVRKR